MLLQKVREEGQVNSDSYVFENIVKHIEMHKEVVFLWSFLQWVWAHVVSFTRLKGVAFKSAI